MSVFFLFAPDIVCELSIDIYDNKTYLTFYTEIMSEYGNQLLASTDGMRAWTLARAA
jgi:hypothetical protein